MNTSESHCVQMTLDLEGDLTTRFRSAKEAMAAGVYRRGLKRVQSLLSELPGLLSAAGAGHVRSKTKK